MESGWAGSSNKTVDDPFPLSVKYIQIKWGFVLRYFLHTK